MPDADPTPDYEGLYAAAAPDPKPTPPGMWEPPLPEEIAAYLPGYDITAVLGRGGMGAVYRGVQTSLDRPVAVKLLPPELGADPEFEARFVREAKSMARLNHPNIVQIYDYGRTAAGHHYIVMEFVDGTDLHRLIHDGGLTVEGALNAVSQICDALAYAHEEGFVHRDIKPANIFINSKGILKVGDFGLAKLVEGEDRPAASALMGLTMSGVAMGTPHYIAPEQLAFEVSVDRRADIYSLGVMFYEMLTREIPRGNVKPPSQKVVELDKRIDGVVFKAMESDPAERYQSAVELRSDVDVIRTTPLPQEPAPGAKGAPRPGKKKSGNRAAAKPQEAGTSDSVPKRRSPALLAAAVGLPLLLAVGGFVAFSGKGGGEAGADANATTAEVASPSESAGRSESSAEPPRPVASPSVPRPTAAPAATPAAAGVAPRVENAVTLEAFLGAEPIFRPDPGFPNSKRNIRLTPDRIHFLNDDGTVDLAHPLRALPNGSVEYVYMSTGRTVTVTFREAFRRLQRSDSNQPTYTFHSLGKPEALPIVAQIRLREPVSAPGRLEAIGSALPADFLSNADPFDDFIQVSAGADAGGNQVIWAALRENGEVVLSGHTANDGVAPPSGVALIRNSRGVGFFFIHRDGRLTVTGDSPEPPSDLRPVVDAVGGRNHALALHPDGSVTLWGNNYPDWSVPEAALRDVVSISASRYGALTVTADGALHVWGRDLSYRRVAAPAGDPFVKVVGVWTNPADSRVLARSGKVYRSDGKPAESPDLASDLSYGGSILVRSQDGSWHAVAESAQLSDRIPDFATSYHFATHMNEKTDAAIRIVPAVRHSGAGTTQLSAAGATSQPRMGRLHVFGTLRVNAETVPVPETDDATDYIACAPSGDAWKALRTNGELVVASPLAGQLPPSPLRDVADHGITGRQAALLKDGSVSLWADHLRDRIGPLEKVRLFDAAHRYAAAIFEDGTARIWNTLESESPDTYQPTQEEIGDVAKVVASNSGVCFLRRDGTVLFCKQNGIRKLLPENLRYIDVVGVTNGFLGLTREGEVVSSGDTDRLLVPDGLPPANAVRSGLRMAAIRTAEGNWMAWAMEGFEEVAKPVIDKIATLRNVVDLGISAGDLHANLLWIEAVSDASSPALTTPATSSPAPASTPADDPVLKIEAAFYDRFGPEVLEPHREAVGRLDEQFLGALNRERASAVSAGDLEGVLAWKTALDRLEAGDGVPSTEELAAESPPAKRPPRLLQFYETYRTELAKLVAARDAKFAPLLKARHDALQALEIESTRSSDLDTAVRAKAARENPPSPEGERPAAAPPVPGAAPSAAMLPPASPALAAQLARYTIDYSRAGTLRVAGTVRQGGPPVPVPQPTAEQAAGVSFVAARYHGGGGWIAVKQDGSIFASGTEDGSAPPAAAKPRWLHAGEQMIAIDHDGKAHLWGRKNWQPARELRHVVKAESGFESAIALHSDGSVSVWGPMYQGFQPDPAWLADAVDVAAGVSRAWVLKSDGTVLGWDREGLLKGPEGDFSRMKDLVAISGSHRRVIGLDRLGRYVNTEGPVPSPLGRMERAVAGYMLDLGLSRGGRLFLDRLDQNQRRFPEAAAPALAARNVIAADGAGDGTEPNFHGFVAWIEGDELPQPPPGRLVVLGYHQDNVNGTERNYPEPDIPAGEGILAVAAQGRHGGAWLAWGASGNPFQQRRAAWGASPPVDLVKIASDFQTATLHRDGSLRFYEEASAKGQPPTNLQGYLDLDIDGHTAAALKRDGSVVLWSEDRAAERTFHPDREWLGDVLQARGVHNTENRVWHFLRRDGSVGRSGADKALTEAGESAFPVPVQAIATARGDLASLALDLEGRILHTGGFHNPLLVSQIPNERGPFVDLRCKGHYAAAQRADGVWIAWGSERERDQALFRQLEAAGPLRELQIAGQNADLDSRSEVGNLVIIGITMEFP